MAEPVIWTYSICRNERQMLPFWLRHYEQLADRMFVWDDKSDDGSRELLAAHANVTLADWPHDDGINEEQLLAFAHEHVKGSIEPRSIQWADWLVWVDIDEFVIGLREFLRNVGNVKANVLVTHGYNMIHDGVPKDDGRQIYEIAPMGVPSPIYSKPIVVKPGTDIRWMRGKHQLEPCNVLAHPVREVKLLHYRYLGPEYTRFKNARNYQRCCVKTGDKAAAWSCAPEYKGRDREGSPEWSEFAATVAFNVFTGVSPESCWRDY